ncbi:MAG: hypothetical protein R2875_17060 [Desulfobacterales bacterium]
MTHAGAAHDPEKAIQFIGDDEMVEVTPKKPSGCAKPSCPPTAEK